MTCTNLCIKSILLVFLLSMLVCAQSTTRKLWVDSLYLNYPSGSTDDYRGVVGTLKSLVGDTSSTGLDSVGVYEHVVNQKIFNVMDYGATNNLSTDVTNNIRVCIDSADANSASITFSAGKYKITDSLLIPTDMGVYLDNRAEIHLFADKNGFVLQRRSNIFGGNIIVDSSVTFTQAAILIDGANEMPTANIIRDIRIFGPGSYPSEYDFSENGGYGIKMLATGSGEYAYFNKFENLQINGFEYAIYLKGESAGNGVNGNQFNNISMNYNKYNLYVDGEGSCNTFLNIQIQPRADATDTTISGIYINTDFNTIQGIVWDVSSVMNPTYRDSAIHFDDDSEGNVLIIPYRNWSSVITDDGSYNDLSAHNYIWDVPLYIVDTDASNRGITIYADLRTAYHSANQNCTFGYSGSSGGSYPFTEQGHLIIEPRSHGGSSSHDVIIATRNSNNETNHRFIFEHDGKFFQDSLWTYATKTVVADDDTISLPLSVSGWGDVMAGDNTHWASFRFTTVGVVTLIDSTSGNISTSAADDNKLCIFDDGAGVGIRNRIGSSQTVAIKISYYTP